MTDTTFRKVTRTVLYFVGMWWMAVGLYAVVIHNNSQGWLFIISAGLLLTTTAALDGAQ